MSIETNPEAYVGKPLPCRRCGRPLDHEETSAFCLVCQAFWPFTADVTRPHCHKCEAPLDVGPTGLAACPNCDYPNAQPSDRWEGLSPELRFTPSPEPDLLEIAHDNPTMDVLGEMGDQMFAMALEIAAVNRLTEDLKQRLFLEAARRLRRPDLAAITREVARK